MDILKKEEMFSNQKEVFKSIKKKYRAIIIDPKGDLAQN